MGLSWGSFQIWANGENICAHYEQEEIVDAVHWYVLPLIEWIAEQWDPLFHEERLPNKNVKYYAWSSLRATCLPPFAVGQDEAQANKWEEAWSKWWRRHCLRSCREGGLFPDVVSRRWRDEIEISWGQSRISGMPEHYRFLSSRGAARIEPMIVADALFDVLERAANYLRSQNPSSNRLAELQRKIADLPSRRRDDRLMWLAGLGIEGWQRIRHSINDFKNAACEILSQPEQNELVVMGSCEAALMFGTVSPEIVAEDVVTLANLLTSLSDSTGDPKQLLPHIRHEPLKTMHDPWDQGYELAESFLNDLHLPKNFDKSIDIEQIINSLGISSGQIELSDISIRGIAIAGSRHRPSVEINIKHDANQFPSGRRFSFAHELCHILYDRMHGQSLALVSGYWAPKDIERRANAFAAMLLMPTGLVESAIRYLDVDLESLEGIKELALQFKTSPDATLHHLHNLGYIDDSVKERIDIEREKERSLS